MGACTNWLVMCGKNVVGASGFILNGIEANNAAGTLGSLTLSINQYILTQTSNWALGELAIWDRHLTLEEMTQASDYLLAVRDAGPSSAPLCPDVD
eukprot:1975511-Rhodomonas_salina.1